MLTGDNELVTRKICREVGLTVEHVAARAREVEPLDDAELGDTRSKRTTVFAKLTPLHKERIVRALRASGHVVGFMGDGINDAPALRAADVGISVDTAVDIAKESADIILLEKSLMVLEEGVIEGRKTFGNMHQVHQDDGQLELRQRVLGAGGERLPAVPADAADAAAGAEPALRHLADCASRSTTWTRNYLRKPRKWNAGDIGRFMLFFGPISSIFDITTFALMWYVFGANTPDHQTLFQSGWFVEGLLTQTLIVHMIRTRKIPFMQSLASAPVLALTVAIILVGMVLPFTGLGAKFGMVPLPAVYFAWVGATVLTYCVLTQLMKLIYIRRYGRWL